MDFNKINKEILIKLESKGEIRLDSFLSTHLDSSKNQVLSLIKNGGVFVNNKLAKKGGVALKENDEIIVLKLESKNEVNLDSIDVDLDVEIIYENDDFLILNKPAFLVVHNAPSVKEPTLTDWLKCKNFSLSTLGGVERYGIVHRLDKETSGAICVAKNNYAHTHLAAQLKDKTMGRFYLALIDSSLLESKIIESHLVRHPKNRLKMASAERFRENLNGRYAKSEFIPLLESKNGFSLIAARLYTGRTHQIRAHLEYINKHIIGDTLYGYKQDKTTRIMLHAYMLFLDSSFCENLKQIESNLSLQDSAKQGFLAPIPADMLQFSLTHFDSKDFYEAIEPSHILSLFGIK